MSDVALRAQAAFGLLALVALAWACSEGRRRFPWRVVAFGIGIQLVLGALLLRTGPGRRVFVGANDAAAALLGYARAGVDFVFGPLAETGFSFALHVLPVVVFMGSLFAILHHLGVVQLVVSGTARLLSRLLGVSGAEGLAAVVNVFVGMVEAPLLVRPWLATMTRSELFCVMTTGMASVAGSVLLAYAQMLGGGEFTGHLVTASVLSCPAGILIAKVMLPETGTPVTGPGSRLHMERSSANLIDAAADGALAGLRLVACIAALLVAFVALIALVNDVLAGVGGALGVADLTLQRLLGFAFAPLAWLTGIPWSEATRVGGLLGVKTVLNEFLAYRDLAELAARGELSPRSVVITSYALCGFANFGSVAILLGGMGGLAPTRRGELARLGLRSIVAGTLATLMTGCVASLLL